MGNAEYMGVLIIKKSPNPPQNPPCGIRKKENYTKIIAGQ